MKMDEELIYNFVEHGSITVETSNTFCKGIKLKPLVDGSLVPSFTVPVWLRILRICAKKNHKGVLTNLSAEFRWSTLELCYCGPQARTLV